MTAPDSEALVHLLLPTRLPDNTTALRSPGGIPPAIIFPADSPRCAESAERIREALARATQLEPDCRADRELLPLRSSTLPASWRQRSLILLGNLNSNRLLPPLYARYLCATDAAYPGAGGYELRTLVNPYGTGSNLILAGGSDPDGVRCAATRLSTLIGTHATSQRLPFLHEIELEASLAKRLRGWPHTPLARPQIRESKARGLQFYTDLLRAIGSYSLLWSWTGDSRYAVIARDSLKELNEHMEDSYGDWHYLAERALRAIPLLSAGGWLSEEELHRTHQLLWQTALDTRHDWWRKRDGRPPLGHRHHGKGTYEFLLLARYLLDHAALAPEGCAICRRWIEECHAFLDALATAGIDDQDDETTLNNVATLFSYALGEERFDFFEDGRARLVAERALALHDNTGAGAGQGGYGEGQAGALYLQQEATAPVAACAFYYKDPELKWVLHHLPNLRIPQRYHFLHYAPVFLHQFETGPEVGVCKPAASNRIHVLPLTGHQHAINTTPPIHLEYRGHMVNAPETWELPEGIAINRLPQVRGFDKIVYRSGFGRRDAYLLLQGYQGGYRWQGHMQAANCIVRFTCGGHPFLIQNTSRHSPHEKNGLFISNGFNDQPLPPCAELRVAAESSMGAISVTRLSPCHQTEWTRHLFQLFGDPDVFIVMDSVRMLADQTCAIVSTWRTPGAATLHGRTWTALQGHYRFTLVAGGKDGSIDSAEEEDQGAAHPTVLRQRLSGRFREGETAALHHCFLAERAELKTAMAFDSRDGGQADLNIDGQIRARFAVQLDRLELAPDLFVSAEAAILTDDSIFLAGATSLECPDKDFKLNAPSGFSLELHFASGRLTLQPTGPDMVSTAQLTIDGQAGHLELRQPVTRHLPTKLTAAIGRACRNVESVTAGQLPAAGSSIPPLPPSVWTSLWRRDTGARLAQRMRHLRIFSDPPPIDGHALQLIDTMLPEIRENWKQWPDQKDVHIELQFDEPAAVDTVRILGDSLHDPTLLTFNPLPGNLRLQHRGPGEEAFCTSPLKPCPPLAYKRYRDMADALEARSATIARTVEAIRLHLPAPADGHPLVLHEIEVWGRHEVPAPVSFCQVEELDGDGNAQIVFITRNRELHCWSLNGKTRWRHALPDEPTHLSCHALSHEPGKTICVGLLGGRLLRFEPDGSQLGEWPIAEAFNAGRDAFIGWFNAIHTLAIWHREPDGRACLAAGGYSVTVFLDPEGKLLGHSWGDGSWITDLLPVPPGNPRAGDLYARCGWNHGVFHYEACRGLEPSGEHVTFGGVAQPMFRMLRRVIPFINGRTLNFSWVSRNVIEGGGILAATELGLGVLSNERRIWQWKAEGGMALRACRSAFLMGEPVALVGSACGFTAAWRLKDGKTSWSRDLGAPVVSLFQTDPQEPVVIATRRGLFRFDQGGNPIAFHSCNLRAAYPAPENRILLYRWDHQWEILTPAEL